jgi:hypothetical protein
MEQPNKFDEFQFERKHLYEEPKDKPHQQPGSKKIIEKGMYENCF